MRIALVGNRSPSVRAHAAIPRALDSNETRSTISGATYATVPYKSYYIDRLHTRYITTPANRWSGNNRTGYSNPQFDRLCDRADIERDPKKRLDLYRQTQAIAVQDAPWSPTYFQKDVELWNPRLRGVEDSLMGHLPHKRTTVE